jgi:hypothetical protein
MFAVSLYCAPKTSRWSEVIRCEIFGAGQSNWSVECGECSQVLGRSEEYYTKDESLVQL